MSLGFVCGEYVGGVGYGRGKWQGIVMRIYYDMVAHSRERVIVDSSLLFVYWSVLNPRFVEYHRWRTLSVVWMMAVVIPK